MTTSPDRWATVGRLYHAAPVRSFWSWSTPRVAELIARAGGPTRAGGPKGQADLKVRLYDIVASAATDRIVAGPRVRRLSHNG
jgi:hypothetical protein